MHFSVQAQKIKKKTTPKKFPIFYEIGISNSNIKKFLIFCYISGNETLKKLLKFLKMELLVSPRKNEKNPPQ